MGNLFDGKTCKICGNEAKYLLKKEDYSVSIDERQMYLCSNCGKKFVQFAKDNNIKFQVSVI